METTEYRKIFRDIIRGYSETYVRDKKYYIKHLTSIDQVAIDEIRSSYYEKAIDRGIPPMSEILEDLNKDGIWTKKDESEIKRLELFVEQAQKTKSELVLKSQIDKQNESIRETRKKIQELYSKRQELLGANAEDYADKRSNDYYIIKSFYSDKDFNDRVFPEEKDYNDLYVDEISDFVSCYNYTFQMFEELKIQEMILQDFYYIYFPFSDDTVGFFGNPVCHLTYNQLKLIVYTKIFKNIFENNQHIPDKIKKDPQALLDYGSVSNEAKDKIKDQISKDGDATTLFGATAEDYEYAGLENPNDQPGISLQKAAERKGGSLSMEDLMELSGHKPK